jgi:hypothetical protein
MNIIRNEKLINRNARIGKITTFVSLGVLGVGMFVTFQQPELIMVSLGALLVGFLLSQVGIYYTNRWGRKPRPDEQIDMALKGFGKQYSLYHYATPAAHFLLGPAGLWVLIPKNQAGKITYERNRWRKRGGGVIAAYLSIFAQEGLGRPDLEIAAEIDSAQKYLKKLLPENEIPPIQAALIFSHPNADIQVGEAPFPTLHAKQAKNFFRKAAKNKPISMSTIEAIREVLPTE